MSACRAAPQVARGGVPRVITGPGPAFAGCRHLPFARATYVPALEGPSSDLRRVSRLGFFVDQEDVVVLRLPVSGRACMAPARLPTGPSLRLV
ncbi:hypothetical protein CG747_44185 [Streptomyces sp. CB02959]|nr:hypothetical protein CG747_44185 [Streptomyces sp. CB02959]